MIISVVNQKGGAGKTTLAVHLAGALEAAGQRVMIADTDPQGSARQWARVDSGSTVPVLHFPTPLARKQVQQLVKNTDVVIIDSPPALAKTTIRNLGFSDLTLIPISPSPLDIWSANETVSLVRQIMKKNRRIKVGLVVFRKIPGTRIGREVREALARYNLPVFRTEITQKVAAVEAMIAGRTVYAFDPRCKSALEFNALAAEILEEMPR